VPAIDCARAIALCQQGGLGCGTNAGVYPTVQLGIWTSQTPATIQPDNSAIPWYTNRLAWLFDWKNISCDFGSGGPAGSTYTPPPDLHNCEALMPIDATSGAEMSYESGGLG
jgi:hypothetical protein